MATRMTKRLKQRKQRDRIGGLPDEILVSILSLLPLKEAGGTCILSKRWRHLWTSLSTLTFAPAGGIMVFHDQPTLELETSRFVNWVDTVMEQHRLPKIEYLKISFDLSKIHAFWINKWIQIALKKRVEILDLDLLELGCGLRQFIPCYTLPQQLLHSSSEYIGSLKVIDFKSVAVTGKTLVYLLSICPFLERLSVYDSQKLVNLRVVGPSVAAALKYLSIEQCFKVKSIEISDAPKLVSLICHRVNDTFGEETTRLISFVIRNVPLLVEVSISVEWMEIFFMGIADCLSQLEILTFHPVMMKYVEYLQFPSLPNLKCLELRLTGLDRLSLLKLTSVIKACPYLHRFVLQISDPTSPFPLRTSLDFHSLSHCTPMEGKKRIKVKASKSPHYYLKIVEIVGYRGLKSDYEHVMYFIENAVELEKLIINPVSQRLIIAERDRVPKDISEVKMEDKARADAMQHLRSKIPSNIEFVCSL